MKKISSFISLIIISVATAFAQNPSLSLQAFSTGYSNPVDVENCGDNRLFIVEQAGKIWISDANGNKSAQPFLDIHTKVYSGGNEQGLLGLAFHPDYKTNGYFYINYINQQQNTVIARYSVSSTDSNKADKTSSLKLLSIPQPASNHNGGCLKFGPDGYLYIGMGDGGGSGDADNNAQNHKKLLGKMLRIDVDNGTPYAIPATNPFFNTVGYKKQIWALGFRNPWRFSFDRATGDLWIGDVGQGLWEEVDYQVANDAGGENYGWRCYEGNHTYNTSGCGPSTDYTFPIAEVSHNSGDCAIIGGFVYRGSMYPNMMGKYFCTDNCSGFFRMIYNNGSWQNVNLGQFLQYSYSSLGEDKDGELYVSSLSDGKIYHITDTSEPRDGSFSIGTGTSLQYLIVYPNPAHGNFTVQFSGEEKSPATLQVMNELGGKVFEEEIPVVKGNNTIDVSAENFVQGIYFVIVSSNSGKRIGKLIVE
ncbi:MAG TPA: PQQ-dependent sugar dehydrogenase [Chitinophagales bacterium]|nr:PQQ-dependent sugar dehydrogenase [Chitinophagales bacterium]